MVDISRYKKITDRSKLTYPDFPSSIAPVPYNDQQPIPIPSTSSSHMSDKSNSADKSEEWCPLHSKQPHFPNQIEVDDLVRSLGL